MKIQLKKLNVIKEVLSDAAAEKLEAVGFERIAADGSGDGKYQENPILKGKRPNKKDIKQAAAQEGNDSHDSGTNQQDDTAGADKADNSGGHGQP